jgi:pimeloyl-ACP methyl ester carboxylesterase
MARPITATNDNAPSPAHIGGEGTALILLHGIGCTWEVWKPVLEALQRRHRVIAMTLPGHYGGPDYTGAGDATVAGLADQIITILRAQGIDRAHVAGNSLGGWLSVELARRGFARSVIAFSPAGGWRSEQDYHAVAKPLKTFHGLANVIRILLLPFIRFAWLRKALAKQTMEHGDRVPARDVSDSLYAMSKTTVMPGLLRTMGRDGPVAPMDAGETPIRIAWSGCDRVIPYARYGEPFVTRIQGADARTVAGVGHVPMYDDPEQIIANILDVTGAVDAARTAIVAAV